MNNFFKYAYTAIAGISLLFIVSCKKNNLVLDMDVTAPAYAKFNTIAAADTIGTYYIKSTNTPYVLPIGITNVSKVDRNIQFTYSSTAAVAGTQFTAPSSLVVKAGTTVDQLSISGLFSGYPLSTRKDTVKITISGGDVPASSYKGVYRLILRKYCDVSLADLYGNYGAIDNGTYGPYPMSVKAGSATSTGATTGTLDVLNLWDYGVVTTTTINLDWTDPANFKVTIPDQVYLAGAGLWIKNSATNGTFSSCDQTFTLNYTLYYKATGASYYANQVTKLKR